MLRRVGPLEHRLGAQMIEKLPLGYRIETGGQVRWLAEQMEASSNLLQARVLGSTRAYTVCSGVIA